MKNIMSVSSRILPPHYTVTNIVTLFSFSVCWKKLQLKKSDLSQSFSMFSS